MKANCQGKANGKLHKYYKGQCMRTNLLCAQHWWFRWRQVAFDSGTEDRGDQEIEEHAVAMGCRGTRSQALWLGANLGVMLYGSHGSHGGAPLHSNVTPRIYFVSVTIMAGRRCR